jgi:hypothetical protein
VTDTGGFVGYSDPSLPGTLWMGTLINSYAKADLVRLCPVTKEQTPTPTMSAPGNCDTAWAWYDNGGGPPPHAAKTYTGSYAINGWLYKDANNYRTDIANNGIYYFKKESNVKYPSDTPIFVDCEWVDLWPWETDPPSTDLYHGGGTSNPPMIGRCRIIPPARFCPALSPWESWTGTLKPSNYNGFGDTIGTSTGTWGS